MTAIRIALGLAALVTVLTLNAQIELSAPAPAEPQYINSFYAVDASAKLIELERQTVTFHAKSKILPGYASITMTTEFKPGRAPVRLPANSRFIVRGRTQIDPVTRFELKLLKASKDHREFIMSRTHGTILGASSTSGLDEGAIPIRFEEYGAGSYRITPDSPLVSGEYALTTRGLASELYCFGVDR